MPGERTLLSPAPQEVRSPTDRIRTIPDLVEQGHIRGKIVLLRGDLDVPVGKGSEDPARSVRLLNVADTADRLVWEFGARKVVILGHMGRPEKERISTRELVPSLSRLLDDEVEFLSGMGVREKIDGSRARFLVLENTRFFEGEQSKDPEEAREFAQSLAAMGDTYVNEAFAVSHRSDVSVAILPQLLPSAAGFHLTEEVRSISKLEQSVSSSVAIMGGAKVADKLPMIEHMAEVMDVVLVGGKLAGEIRDQGVVVPENVVVAVLDRDGFDISRESAERFVQVIGDARTIVWNGPMGWFEKGYDAGTKAVAQAICDNFHSYSVVGGGDTVSFLTADGSFSEFSFVSAGGGAMQELLAGKHMPGIEALKH